ncbi:MAG: S8 family serine peptidase [Armatimonadetes bacterium]|nr:S8 family serine peptidase [Armatimonadota bacterium]
MASTIHPFHSSCSRLWFAAGLLVCIGLAPLAAPAAGVPGPAYRQDTVLVAFKNKAPLAVRLAPIQRLGLTADPKVRSPFFTRLQISPAARAAGATVKSVLAALRGDPSVRVAEPDYTVHALAIPNDLWFSELWGLHNTGQTGGTPDADIDAPEAWDITTGSTSVVVAVIDTGVDYTHPDLSANILRSGGQVVGYDYYNNDLDPMDDYGHGTHVAGTIGAVGNNGIGVAGVCHTVRIMPLKFLGSSGSGSTSDAILCVDFARANGAQIMNNSWGGGGFSQLLLEAIQRARDAGILFVASAGNEGTNNDEIPRYPTSYNSLSDNMVSVAATDHDDTLAGFSNYGVATVDIAAPGVDILSTLPGGYYWYSGTSMAAPHVSGAAALIKARYPAITLAQLKGRLLGGADYPPAINGRVVTGRLNVLNALEDDVVAPGSPTGLTATQRASTALLLTWTASGDDGSAGAAARYEVRYSTSPINDGNFGTASRAISPPRPGVSGTGQSYLLSGLADDTNYYIALRALDNAGNPSALVTAGPYRTLRATPLLVDDVEGDLQFTGQFPWAVTTEASASPSHAYTDSPGALYRNLRDVSLIQNTALTLTGNWPVLTFRARTDLESDLDFLYVEVSADNGLTWAPHLALTGISGWTLYSVPLAPYRGQSVKVRFRLVTDGSVVQDGVWLDDIRISTRRTATYALEDNVEGTLQFSGPSPWAATTEERFSPIRSYTDSPSGPYADYLDISLTQNVLASTAGFVPVLLFWATIDVEQGWDYLHVEVSTDDGASWRRLSSRTGTTRGIFYNLPLTAFLGQNVKVRFRLVTDTSVTQDGVWLDDIRIGGETLFPLSANGPAPPSSLSVTGASGAQIDLSWTDNSNNEAGFEIERQTAGEAFSVVASVGPGVTTYSDTDLNPNTTYFYRVRAFNTVADSVPSNEVSADTLTNLPAAPTDLNATAVSATQINLRWTDNSDNETGFKIERKTAGGSFSQIAIAGPNVTQFADIGLNASTTYTYRVRATNAGSDSANSSEVDATTFPNPPATPSGLAVAVVSQTQLNLSWTDNSVNETGFEVERSRDGVAFGRIGAVGPRAGTGSLVTYSNTGLNANTTYYYRVRATNAGGVSGYSNIASAATPPDLPAPPTGLTANIASLSQIDLSWADNSANETGFEIWRKLGNGNFALLRTVGPNETALTDVGLAANTPCVYRVRAINADGPSSYSNTASVTIPVGGRLKSSKRLTFTRTPAGGTSTRSLVIQNIGSGPLAGSIDTLAAPFRVVSGGGYFTLAAGASRTVTVEFASPTPGTFTALLAIASTDASRPLANISVRGTARSASREIRRRPRRYGAG